VLRKLFIGGLNSSTTNESLHAYFSQYGEVASATVMKDLGNGRSAVVSVHAVCVLLYYISINFLFVIFICHI